MCFQWSFIVPSLTDKYQIILFILGVCILENLGYRSGYTEFWDSRAHSSILRNNINHIFETLIRQLIKLKKLIVVSIILWCRHTYLNTQDEYEGKRTFDGIDCKSWPTILSSDNSPSSLFRIQVCDIWLLQSRKGLPVLILHPQFNRIWELWKVISGQVEYVRWGWGQ